MQNYLPHAKVYLVIHIPYALNNNYFRMNWPERTRPGRSVWICATRCQRVWHILPGASMFIVTWQPETACESIV